MPSGGYTSTLVGTRARVAPGSRWPSDLHSDGSLLLPSTLMAVELSGDTGAPTQSHIRVQSVQSSTCCHNDYNRSIKMFFIYLYIYILLYSLSSPYRRPTCVPLDCPWWLTKSSSFLKTSLLGGTKQFPSPAPFPFSSPAGSSPYVPDNTPWDRQGGVFLFHTQCAPLSRVIHMTTTGLYVSY